MDHTQNLNNAAIMAAGAVILGYVWQWARGPQKIPNWLTYALAVIVSGGVYAWATPDIVHQFTTDWRYAVLGLWTFFTSSRGFAAMSKDGKAAPQTNSL